MDRKLLIVREALDFFLLLFNHLSCGVSPLLSFRLDSIAFSLFVCSHLSVATRKCEAEEGEGKREIKRKTGNEREDEDMKSQGCSFHDSLAKLLIFIQLPVLILLLLFAVQWILNRMYARFLMKESQVLVLFL